MEQAGTAEFGQAGIVSIVIQALDDTNHFRGVWPLGVVPRLPWTWYPVFSPVFLPMQA
jgi:hypothetical protein